MLSGSLMSGAGQSLAPNGALDLGALVRGLSTGWPFAASLLGILLAHEFGHYLMSRHHRTPATLPYFIPFPLSPLGTMGAFIAMRAVPRNKRVLFDIGVAGPLAGLAVAIPVLLLGLSMSSVAESSPTEWFWRNSVAYLLAKLAVFHKLLPEAPRAGIAYWVQYFFWASRCQSGGGCLHSPDRVRGLGSLLVTAQPSAGRHLDNGHVVYSVFGEKASRAFPFVLAALAAMGMFWSGWWVWALLLFWLGRVHADPLDQVTPLDTPRRVLAGIMMVIFLLVFSPVPFMPLVP
jgi:membrane-associated protease RseP (regulator of RpoE activity)